MYLLLLVAASLLFATGGLFMKLSLGLTRPGPSALIFVFFGAGAVCQAYAMKRADMGVTYSIVLGLESIAAFLISVFALRESAAPTRILAVVMIAGGIVLLDRS